MRTAHAHLRTAEEGHIDAVSPDSGLTAPWESESARKLAAIAAALLLVAHVALVWFARQPHLLREIDGTWYLLLARSIHDFGYHDIHVVGQPPHTRFPPFYPLFLAIVTPIFGEGLNPLIAINALLSAFALWLVYRVVSKLASPWVGVLCLAPAVVNPSVVRQAATLWSEPLYMVFSIGALVLLADRTEDRKILFAAGAGAILAALTRVIGLAMLGSLLAYWLLTRRWRPAIILGVTCAAIGAAALAWVFLSADTTASSYVEDFTGSSLGQLAGSGGGLPSRIVRAVTQRFGSRLLDSTAFPMVPGAAWDNLIGIAVIGIGGLVGIWWAFRKWTAGAIYLAAYSAIVILYPYFRLRYWGPVLPLIIAVVIVGLVYAGSRWRPKLSFAFAALVALMLTISGTTRSIRYARDMRTCGSTELMEPHPCGADWEEAWVDMMAWMRDNIEPDAVLHSYKSPMIYYQVGLKSAPYPESFHYGTAGFADFLEKYEVDYVTLSGRSFGMRDAPLLQRVCERLELAATFREHTFVFRVLPEGEAAEADSGPDECALLLPYTREMTGG